MSSSASQQQLRLLMKQQQASKGAVASSLSGKDKAKMLKAMRSGAEPAAVSDAHKPRAVAAKAAQKAPSAASSALPAGFFDEGVSAQPVVSVPATQTHTQLKAPPAVAAEAATNSKSSSLPVGFFDDVAEDFQARGLSYEKVLQEQAQAEESALTSFMSEIKDISEEMEEVEEQQVLAEKELEESEEAMLQMSYLAKYAALLQASDKLMTQSKSQSEAQSNDAKNTSTQEGEAVDIEKVVKEAEEIQSIAKVHAAQTDRAARVESIVMQKLLAKRKAHEAKVSDERPEKVRETETEAASSEEEDEDESSDEEEYSPLAFMNFSGKY